MITGIALLCLLHAPELTLAGGLVDEVTLPGLVEEAASQQIISYGITSVKGINVRKKPDEKAVAVGKLPITGTAVRIIEEILDAKQTLWYRIEMENKPIEGYVRFDLIDEITADEYEEILNKSKTRPTVNRVTPSPSPSVSKIQNITGNHSAYPGSTTVWIENSIYHSDQTCPRVENGEVSTLQTAQSRGVSPCGLCWCYGCLFGE